MDEGHSCDVCQTYERETMAGTGGDLAPCSDYKMSAAFQSWVVDSMRGEVMAQVSGSGLDRMAILKASEEE